MGCTESKPHAEPAQSAVTPFDYDKAQISKSIDVQLRKDGAKEKQVIKMLILGAGESGKSTIVKQMSFIYRAGGLPEGTREDFIDIVVWNSIQSMQSILDALPALNLQLADETPRTHSKFLLELSGHEPVPQIAPKVAAAITCLRDNESVQAAIGQRHAFQLNDSAEYFFAHIERTTQKDYMPTDADILRARVKTTGITEICLSNVDGISMRVIDVGGQRSERKKWIHCFENVNVLLFVVSVSEYDQVIREDKDQPRMQESLLVYDSIVNSRWFTNSAHVLFLNKIDILEHKLPKSPLIKYYPNFKGEPTDTREAIRFFRGMFEQLVKDKKRPTYTHSTTATDTNLMKKVLRAVSDILLRDSLAGAALL